MEGDSGIDRRAGYRLLEETEDMPGRKDLLVLPIDISIWRSIDHSQLTMDISIVSTDNKDHLLVQSVGKINNKEELIEHAKLMYAEAVKYNHHKILIDDTETVFPLNVADYVAQIEFIETKMSTDIRHFRVAIIMAPAMSGMGKLWEFIANKRGFQFESFTSHDKALEWLLKGT